MTPIEFEKMDLLAQANAYAEYLRYELIELDPEIIITATKKGGVRIYTRTNEGNEAIIFENKEDLESHIVAYHGDNFFEMMEDYTPEAR